MSIGRALVCVGCDIHDAGDEFRLFAAEADAKAVFDALIDPKHGDYDPFLSFLLLSPTLGDIRSALAKIATSAAAISTLTFYFAGHGEISAGSLYLYARDTNPDALSVSAFSLSDVTRLVADQQVPHTNIILDACYSGGAWSDLGPLLNADATGARYTPGLTLLAMAASNETATEDDRGGLGTRALLECIRGDTVCNVTSPTLDLIEIGQEVAEAFDGSRQQPKRWGLNLTGRASFCYNPAYEGDAASAAPFGSLTDFPAIHFSELHRDAVWKTYFELASFWEPRPFYELLDTLLTDYPSSPSEKAAFVVALATSLVERAERHPDRVTPSQVLAVCSLALMKHSGADPAADEVCKRLFKQSLVRAVAQLNKLSDELSRDRYALLSRQGGGFDFYHLPIRVSFVLGWAAAAALVDANEEHDSNKVLLSLLDQATELYGLNMIAMSDKQASSLALLGAALAARGEDERLKQALSHYLHSLALVKGLVADTVLAPDRIFDYLAARFAGTLSQDSEIIAQPSELVAVCLLLGANVGLGDVVDAIMIDLDHVWLNAFFPDSYRGIGDDILNEGRNITMRIGHEIWNVKDFEKAWSTIDWVPPATDLERTAAILASLIFPDRVSWFAIATAFAKTV